MKMWKKTILIILLFICLIVLGFIFFFINEEKKVAKYSTYCMDRIRSELWEYVWNVSCLYEWKNDNWYYLYSWNVSYEWADYIYYCRVLGKDKVNTLIQEVASDDVENLDDEWNVEEEVIKENIDEPEISDETDLESDEEKTVEVNLESE